MNLDDIIELRKKILEKEISIDDAKNLFWENFKEGRRSWQTKDWKERRAKLIKEKCQICGSKERLTIQHLEHPKKHSYYLKEVTRRFTKLEIDLNASIEKSFFTDFVIRNHDYFPVPLCPGCETKKIKLRKRKIPKYRCDECKFEFNEPKNKLLSELISNFYEENGGADMSDFCFVSKDQYKNRNNIYGIKYWIQREFSIKKNSKEIEKEAFLLYIEDSIKYLSFQNTITTCNLCAFNFDVNRMNLCPKCRINYKGIQYKTCINCLPEEQRSKAMEAIKFGKEMSEIRKRLGID